MNTVITIPAEQLEQKKEFLELSIEMLIRAFELEINMEIDRLTLLKYPLWKDGCEIGCYTKVYVEV